MNKAEKASVVSDLKHTFEKSQGVILLSFDRINVPDITELRAKIREKEGSYRVVKNTLALIASEGTPMNELKEHFQGPTAIAFTESDPVALAKTLKEYVKIKEGFNFKGGVVEGRVISIQQVEQLADLPSREELLSKLLFLLSAPLTQFATALISPLRNLAYGLSQVGEQKK
jgi:large subunit ribosomal protein L10